MRTTFWDPRFIVDEEHVRYATGPWSGHRMFAYHLVTNLRPITIVELGVHWGVSLFAFAQAVADAELLCRLVGIDTWSGYEHADDDSHEGDEILASVKDLVERRFSGADINLVRDCFEQQVDRHEANSIDILHINGFYSYDTAEASYKMWLPKLSENGIVLMHGTSSETNYGSARFAEELRAELPHLHFEHSYGLTVLAPKGAERLDLLSLRLGAETLTRYYERNDCAVQLRRQLSVAEATLEEQCQLYTEQREHFTAALDESYRSLERELHARIIAESHAEADEYRALQAGAPRQENPYELERLEHELTRLRSRRSVRIALALAMLARPLFRMARGQPVRWRA